MAPRTDALAPTKRPRTLRMRPLNQEPAHVAWVREARHLTRAQVAVAIGKAPSLITEIEKGTRNATPEVLAGIADFLGCPISLIERRVRPDMADVA